MNSQGDLQLLPGTKKRLGIKIPGENRFLYIGSAILGAAIVTVIALNQYTKSLEAKLNNINSQIIGIEESRNRAEETNLIRSKEQFDIVKKLIDEHIYWTKGLDILVSLFQSDVKLNSIVAEDGRNNIDMSIIARNYTVLARQIASLLSGDGIKDVNVGKIEFDSSGNIETSLIIKYDKQRFLLK